MRIFVNDVIESNITQQELHDACILKLYLARFSPILGLYLFTSSQTCCRYFNDVKHVKQIYRWCIYFGPSMVYNILLNGKKFYLPKTRLDPTLRLQLNSLNEDDCRKFFRFDHSEIKQIITLLQLPEVIITPVHNDRVLAVEAFCLLLCRLSYPKRWIDLQKQFGRHKSLLAEYFII
jgi:hypothetical protein